LKAVEKVRNSGLREAFSRQDESRTTIQMEASVCDKAKATQTLAWSGWIIGRGIADIYGRKGF